MSPGQTLLDAGPITIRWYGFLIACAFLACLYVATKIKRERYPEISDDDLANFAMVIIVGAIVGARSWFVALNWDYFSLNLNETYQIWLGGQSIQGGIVGAFIASLIFELFFVSHPADDNTDEEIGLEDEAFVLHDSMPHYVDKLALIALVTPIGQAIGRWGNFFNEEAYGSVTSLPWGLYVSQTGNYHHPTFLYESIGNLVIFALLFYLSKRITSMQTIAAYLFFYSSLRILIEPIRTDSLYLGSFKAATIVSIVMLLISGSLFVFSLFDKK